MVEFSKEISTDNLNKIYADYHRVKGKVRFGQLFMSVTGFELPTGYKGGFDLWNERDTMKAYGVIFDYLWPLEAGIGA